VSQIVEVMNNLLIIRRTKLTLSITTVLDIAKMLIENRWLRGNKEVVRLWSS